uniref:Uncharacterized protein n=1 Tax=Cannabis sativa TaxID=3483 RepID=A0A803P5T1_CANSA
MAWPLPRKLTPYVMRVDEESSTWQTLMCKVVTLVPPPKYYHQYFIIFNRNGTHLTSLFVGPISDWFPNLCPSVFTNPDWTGLSYANVLPSPLSSG